ncbi:uncharacterized protein LOC123989259 [Osmia bicornis bicornis]|uniref:uncharacterized protein LOC123989259 n=1 Tax=Osmia bicornis bicornis TaxID=1437191 RepID=UPI001EAEA025|nr:uncharacterized protein LOC123989259 [Osmia bicornis bicornis]
MLYSFPVKDNNRLIEWIMNSGNDDFAELTDGQLKRRYICTRHFAEEDKVVNIKLKKDAVPVLYDLRKNNEQPAPTRNSRKYSRELLSTRKQKQINQLKLATQKLRKLLASKNKQILVLKRKLESYKMTELDFDRNIKDKVSNNVKTFMLMQLYPHPVFSADEQQICLSMHYSSPSLFRKLRDNFGFHLPCPRTISRWFGSIEMWPGICTTFFTQLRKKVSWMDDSERNCVLLFDEMTIKKSFDFHSKKQKIEGFQDYGAFGSEMKPGTQALVFMVRGLFYNWKQPVAYFISNSNISTINLLNVLEAVIAAVCSTGLRVRAIVCDQGSVSWSDISSLWDLERNKGTRAVVKLSEKHIRPNVFERMNCRLALQVFSRTVSAALLTASTQGQIQSDTVAKNACFVRLLNDLFDNLNSRTAHDANPQKCALSNRNPQIEENLIRQATACANWFVIQKGRQVRPPCFRGLQLSINATIQLWRDIRDEGASYLMTSRLQQDPIENLFSMIRHNAGNYEQNPSAKTFRLNLQKNMMLNLMMPSQSANCLDDEDCNLFTLPQSSENVASTSTENSSLSVNCDSSESRQSLEAEDTSDTIIADILQQVSETAHTLESCAIEYFAGYVARKNIRKTNCDICKAELLDSTTVLSRNEQILIFLRAYKTNNDSDFGRNFLLYFVYLMLFLIKCILLYGLKRAFLIKYFRILYKVLTIHLSFVVGLTVVRATNIEKKIAYFMMKVKIHKDTIWLGQELRRPKTSFHKPTAKVRKLQNM